MQSTSNGMHIHTMYMLVVCVMHIQNIYSFLAILPSCKIRLYHATVDVIIRNVTRVNCIIKRGC